MKAYWFSTNGWSQQDTLHKVGQTYTVAGTIVPCSHGLHGSEHPFDALANGGGEALDIVELSGTLVPHGDPVDTYAASHRTHLARIDATDLLLAHAQWCTLQVAHLCDAPANIVEYQRTGDESLCATVRATGHTAAWAAGRVSANVNAFTAARAAQRADVLARVEEAFRALQETRRRDDDLACF